MAEAGLGGEGAVGGGEDGTSGTGGGRGLGGGEGGGGGGEGDGGGEKGGSKPISTLRVKDTTYSPSTIGNLWYAYSTVVPSYPPLKKSPSAPEAAIQTYHVS